MAFALGEFRLSKCDKQGTPLRVTLTSVWRQTGQKPGELETPDCPDELVYVWEWFCQLNCERGRSMEGTELALDSTKLANWCWLEKVRLSSFELRMIRQLDRAYLSPPPKIPDGEIDDD